MIQPKLVSTQARHRNAQNIKNVVVSEISNKNIYFTNVYNNVFRCAKMKAFIILLFLHAGKNQISTTNTYNTLLLLYSSCKRKLHTSSTLEHIFESVYGNHRPSYR